MAPVATKINQLLSFEICCTVFVSIVLFALLRFFIDSTSAETVLHYRMRRQGYQEERKWPSPGQPTPFSVQLKKPRVNVDLIGESFLRRFQNPTIFLKISCDGDFLLPIIVGIYG